MSVINGAEIVGLIFAIAFVVLVIFLCIFLARLTKTVSEINHTINFLSKDVNLLSKEVEDILSVSDVLINNINKKLNVLDPVFLAAAALGDDVIKLSDQTKKLGSKVNNSRGLLSKLSLFATGGKMLRKVSKGRSSKSKTKENDVLKTPPATVSSTIKSTSKGDSNAHSSKIIGKLSHNHLHHNGNKKEE